MCSQFTRSNYQDLCHTHRNNPWKIYFWSRVVHCSIEKSIIKDLNELLYDLVVWLQHVAYDNYRRDDTITISFVNTIFENIIMKHINSAFLSPNIEILINFILTTNKDNSHLINQKSVKEFMEKAQQWMSNIFLLKSKRKPLSLHLKY